MDHLQERVRRYWAGRAPMFAEQRTRELESPKRERWMAELSKYLPLQKRLNILDAGTGTGFFSVMLAAMGHRVTGIDIAGEMIEGAKNAARKSALDIDFFVMDAEAPSLPPASFDAVVTRNLTWTLPNLSDTYRRWSELLVPGGVLINFDADYCCELAEAKDADELPENHAHKSLDAKSIRENEAITLEVGAYQRRRPEWDVRLLIDAGFSRVTVDSGVWERIYAERDEFFNPVPIFSIAAYKNY